MSDSRTTRVLEIDGGGQRVYMALKFLIRYVAQWGIPETDLWKYFDVICGSSAGAMVALGLALGLTPTQLLSIFTVQGPYIFSLSSLIASVRPNLAAKLALIATDTAFYQSSGPTAASYGQGLLNATAQSMFGTNTLQNLKTNVIIPCYEQDTSKYVLFSNLNYPGFTYQNELVSNIALASGAAPIYFDPVTINGHQYIDTGVYQNNPSQFGRVAAQMLKKTLNKSSTRTCILSIGTGIGEMGFDQGNPDVIDTRVDPAILNWFNSAPDSIVNNMLSKTIAPRLYNSVATIFGLFDIASTGGQESVAKALYLESKYTLSQLYYYRFQPQLNLNLNTELDNTDAPILTYYDETEATYFNNDIDAISTFIGHTVA